MKFAVVLALAAFSLSAARAQTTQWVLEQSTLTWHIMHPMHDVDGVSHAAKGKGVCSAGFCDFLIAVPVNTFNSGDSNRDLHTIQTVRGAEFPMVIVRTRIPELETSAPSIDADLVVQFAGQTAHYSHVPFHRIQKGNEVEITGTVPATCSDFKIERPSFLTVPIHNEIPVTVDATWKQQ
ncbi:MAG TPA: hypothetical protein VHX37_03235 [Acidobacteriaceae bacterium]|jgi:hypothetical protein|nr:hypothetical protein [Acidobacteriaceae bacterium]